MSYTNNGSTRFGPSIEEKENGFKKQYILNSKFIDNNIDLVIWDFDNTLIDTKAYSLHSMSPDFIREEMTLEQLEWDIPYWKFFRQTVIDLVNSGKRVGIASFGMYNIIRAYMDRIFGVNQKYFTVVNTFARCKIDEPPQQNKNGYILNIMEHYRITSPDRVLLFDDLASNIAAAIELGFVAILVDGVQYTGNGQRSCSGLFGPKTMVGVDNYLRAALNKSNPLHIADLGHVGDRKAAINMYGRRDKAPMSMKKYIYPDSLFMRHRKEPPSDINIYDRNFNGIPDEDENIKNLNKRINSSVIYSEPQFKAGNDTKNINNNEPFTVSRQECTDCNTYSPILYLSIFVLFLLVVIALYWLYNTMIKK
jgi:hypothetical protein